ncbi:hypothetical protein ACFLKB_13575 [Clostridium sp. FAM 1755]|uniref:hypothetical protein n=1 Tax=Clostridium caseinilyticum TaxID=3350403 RepID=UPI0038F65DD4
MKNIFRLVYNNIKSMFSIRVIFSMCLLFGFMFIYKKTILINYIYLEDYIKYIFYVPKQLLENIPELFLWSLCQFSFIGTLANYLNKEFKVRNTYYIARLGTKLKWYFTVQLTVLFSALFYYFIAFIEIWILSFFININISILGFNKLMLMLMLLLLSSYLYINVYINFILWCKHSNCALLYIILLIYLVIYIGGTFNIDLYNLFTQGIFSKMNEQKSLIISNVYLAIINIFTSIAAYRMILTRDVNTVMD